MWRGEGYVERGRKGNVRRGIEGHLERGKHVERGVICTERGGTCGKGKDMLRALRGEVSVTCEVGRKVCDGVSFDKVLIFTRHIEVVLI